MLIRSMISLLLALAVLRPATGLAQTTERLYREACEGGDLTACNVFGLMYETGQGVPQDYVRAAELYQRACEGGQLVGCTNVGLLHAAGAGVPQDTVRAGGFFRVACEGGEQLGCTLMRTLQDAMAATPTRRYEKAGRVGDVFTSRPLAEAVVELPAAGVRVVSDAEGRFLLSGVPEGRHAIRAERLGYDPLVGEVEIPGNPDFFMLMTPAEIVDPDASGQIVGRVLEGGDRGLSDVEVSVVDQERARTLSNAQGRFVLLDVQPGLVVVRFARLGYAPRSATLIVQPGRTAEVAATMSIRPVELAPVEVTVRSLDLERSGFYERAQRGFGRHFTPGDLERIQPIDASDLFRGVPGVRVVRMRDPSWGYVTRLVSRRGGTFSSGPCALSVFVDGVRMIDANVDFVDARSIAAAEVYQGPGTPLQFIGPNGCGSVLFWTRRN